MGLSRVYLMIYSAMAQAFLQSYHLVPRHPIPPSPVSCLSFSVFLRVKVDLIDGRGGGARSQIIRPQEGLAFYKSFNILWA